MSPANLSTKRRWIAELASRKRQTALTLLHHLIDLEWMYAAYELTRKDGAAGIDGVTAQEYEADLEANLLDLLGRIKSGRYRAPLAVPHPVRVAPVAAGLMHDTCDEPGGREGEGSADAH